MIIEFRNNQIEVLAKVNIWWIALFSGAQEQHRDYTSSLFAHVIVTRKGYSQGDKAGLYSVDAELSLSDDKAMENNSIPLHYPVPLSNSLEEPSSCPWRVSLDAQSIAGSRAPACAGTRRRPQDAVKNCWGNFIPWAHLGALRPVRLHLWTRCNPECLSSLRTETPC